MLPISTVFISDLLTQLSLLAANIIAALTAADQWVGRVAPIPEGHRIGAASTNAPFFGIMFCGALQRARQRAPLCEGNAP
jgi:hypothetical protein